MKTYNTYHYSFDFTLFTIGKTSLTSSEEKKSSDFDRFKAINIVVLCSFLARIAEFGANLTVWSRVVYSVIINCTM